MFRIESLLSARLFMAPQLVAQQVFFISNLSGKLSLYRMAYGGSVPEPLLPPNIAMQNPHLIGGYSYYVFPKLEKILVMLDQDGDENYRPYLISLGGGFPEALLPDVFNGTRCHLGHCDADLNMAYIDAESQTEALMTAYKLDLAAGKSVELSRSEYGRSPLAHSSQHDLIVMSESYTIGDDVVYLWQKNAPLRLIYGKPIEQRAADEQPTLAAFFAGSILKDTHVMLFASALFSDTYSLGIIDLEQPESVLPVELSGVVHQGMGELAGLTHLQANSYAVEFNIDGCSWLYEAEFDLANRQMNLLHVVVGERKLSNGVLEGWHYDKLSDRFVVTFSTAISPTQIYTVEGAARKKLVQQTHERVFGIPEELLAQGEDASFYTFDGSRASARLYMPAEALGFKGPRPLVYYIHGGPQSQERPDFAWFSMPLIQFLTLNGFAVFVPNVRGSTGYGLSYTKQVDRDWGGKDRLDHVHALKVLAKDKRIDTYRAAVVGRSYGGYMTLIQAAQHADLWTAAVDMFGPFDLLSFLERIPPTWKPYYKMALGDVVEDRAFLVERSPRTYMHQIQCPMLVIQGKNDPRVIEHESRDLVDYLRNNEKPVEYIVFENEGHDVLKFENRVTCYNSITNFFKLHLKP